MFNTLKGLVMSNKVIFNKAAFEQAFGASLILLAGSEKVTKAELQVLSRSVLEATHITEDHGYMNRLIQVLTPVNKKVAIAFLKHFSGFSFDDALGAFGKKSKKRYDAAHKLSIEFLEDPMNNIWSWADRNIEIVQKDFSLADVTAGVKRNLKKAKEAGFTQAQVFKAMIDGGLEIDTVLGMLDELGYAEVVADPAAPVTQE